MGLTSGDKVGGRYQIIRLLGAGNFGETYLAEDLHAGRRKCAVKRFNFASHNPGSFNKARELFEREAKVLLELSDPPRNNQIPKFYAYFDENQEFYLVQEFIEGRNLGEELQKTTRLEKDDVIELLKDVLEILQFIHSENIIHRDIKPENLMRRDQDGKIFLIDFGAVKEVVVQSVNANPRQRPTLIYTEGYAPREQRQGKPQLNSDIYALGMTALQAWTGLEPENLKDANTDKVIWGSQIQVNDNLAKIIEKMVDEDYKRRYQSADDVLNDIQKYQKTWVVSPKSQSLIIQPVTGLIANIPLWWRFMVLGTIGTVLVGTISFIVVKVLITPSDSTQPSDTGTSPSHSTKPSDTSTSPRDSTKPSGQLPNNCPPFIAPDDPCLKQQ